jgi:rubredoxin
LHALPAVRVQLPENSFLFFDRTMKTYQCVVCGFVYDEAQGRPEDGIAPGTKWEDVPDNWECPDCGVGKSDFEMIEI